MANRRLRINYELTSIIFKQNIIKEEKIENNSAHEELLPAGVLDW